MRPRIRKSTSKLEFCYSSVVSQSKDSKLAMIKAELSELNAQLSSQNPTTPVGVEYKLFGKVVRRDMSFVEKLKEAKIEYKIIYK